MMSSLASSFYSRAGSATSSGSPTQPRDLAEQSVDQPVAQAEPHVHVVIFTNRSGPKGPVNLPYLSGSPSKPPDLAEQSVDQPVVHAEPHVPGVDFTNRSGPQGPVNLPNLTVMTLSVD